MGRPKNLQQLMVERILIDAITHSKLN